MRRSSQNRQKEFEFSLKPSDPVRTGQFLHALTLNPRVINKNNNLIRVTKKKDSNDSIRKKRSEQKIFNPSKTMPQPPKEKYQNSFRYLRKSHHTKRKKYCAAEQLRDFIDHFKKLEAVIRDFLRNNTYFNKFAAAWKQYKDSCDYFIEQASNCFSSNFDIENIYVLRPITKTTPIYQSTTDAIEKWNNFVDEAKEITNESYIYFDFITDDFRKLHLLIQKTLDSIPNLKFRTDTVCVQLDAFQSHIISVNDEIADLVNSGRKIDEKRLHQQICYLNREASEIFTRSLRSSSMNLAIKIQIRTEFSATLSSIEESLIIAQKTTDFIKEMHKEIELSEKEFKRVLNKMSFPLENDESVNQGSINDLEDEQSINDVIL